MKYKQFIHLFVYDDTTPFEEGALAKAYGFSLDDNPYSKLLGEHVTWRNGWTGN
jgi:hypothetical protein